MKKFFSLFAAVLFAGSMMATEVTITPENSGWTTTAGAQSGVVEGVTIATSNGLVGTADNVKAMRIYKNQTLTISAESNIISIEFTCTAKGAAQYGPGCFKAQEGYTFEASSKKGTWTGSATSVTFTAETNQVRATEIKVVYGEQQGIAAPSFLPEDDAFIDSVEVSISAVEGADIYYTLDETDPTDESTKYETPFKLFATTTVKAFAIKGEDTSKVATKAYSKIETISVAEAIEKGMKLDSMGTSAVPYIVEGFVLNAEDFSLTYGNQSWDMADDAENAESQKFHAYACYPIEGEDTLQVLNGDKVQLMGKLKKFYNKNEKAFLIEIEKGVATFLSKTEGDHTVDRTIDTITVADALEIGATLKDGGVTDRQYCIEGYVSFIANLYDATKKSENFWIADTKESQASSNADGAFYVYSGKPKNEQELGLGAKVRFVSTIKKYVKEGKPTVIENDKAVPVEVLEQGELVVDTLGVAEAKAEALKLEKNQTGAKFYAVKGYIYQVKEEYSTQYKNASFYICDNGNSTADDVYCYHAALDASDASKVAVGSYVIVTGHLLHNFYNNRSTAQIPSGSAIFTEAPEPFGLDTIPVADAVAIASALENNETTTETYAVLGYVAKIDEAYSEEHNNISFYMTDNATSTYGDLQCKYANIDAEAGQALAPHDKVLIVGHLTNNFYNEKNTAQVLRGDLSVVEKAQAIEKILMNDPQIKKVIMDGVVYIVRDGKMFDVHGAQVR